MPGVAHGCGISLAMLKSIDKQHPPHPTLTDAGCSSPAPEQPRGKLVPSGTSVFLPLSCAVVFSLSLAVSQTLLLSVTSLVITFLLPQKASVSS